jgi:FixJ family two-component response regulator
LFCDVRLSTNLSAAGLSSDGSLVQNKELLIAVVDDDKYVGEAIKDLMRSSGFAAVSFSSGNDFLASSELSRTACVIADINMPKMSGFDLCRCLLTRDSPIPTILVTAYPTENGRLLALEAGVVKYLVKPFDDADLLDGISIALAQRPQANEA